MKTHVAFLAASVLCLESAVLAGVAAAQTPATAPEVAPAPASAPAPPPLPPAAPDPTPVDTAPPGPVNGASPLPPPPAAPPPSEAPPSTVAPPPDTTPAASQARPNVAPPVASASPSLAEGVKGLGAPRYRDAHIDRLLLAPTAETHPKGSFYATSYEIVLLQLGYAISDTTQISFTGTPPLGEAHVIPADLSLKTVVLREPHVSVAAIASASGVLGFEEFSGFLGRAGAVATFCADARECRLSFSMSSNLALIGPASLLFSGAGLSYRAGRIVSLVAELDTVLPLGEVVGEANGLLGGAGVRLSGRAWGVDLALMKAGKARAEPSTLVPFIAATYRYLP